MACRRRFDALFLGFNTFSFSKNPQGSSILRRSLVYTLRLGECLAASMLTTTCYWFIFNINIDEFDSELPSGDPSFQTQKYCVDGPGFQHKNYSRRSFCGNRSWHFPFLSERFPVVPLLTTRVYIFHPFTQGQ